MKHLTLALIFSCSSAYATLYTGETTISVSPSLFPALEVPATLTLEVEGGQMRIDSLRVQQTIFDWQSNSGQYSYDPISLDIDMGVYLQKRTP